MTSDGTSAQVSRRIAAWLEALPEERRCALAAEYAGRLAEDGLAVYRPTENLFVPIPPVLTPEPLEPDFMARLSSDARLLLSATVKLARFTFTPPGKPIADRLYAAFTPLELECLGRDPDCLSRVATARVDYFVSAETSSARALELNATIPAMQGYSDLIAQRFVRLMARERGLSVSHTERLVVEAGQNSLDLLRSIVAHYHAQGGRADKPSILVVSRRGDAQLGELFYYQRLFRAAGHLSQHVFVDEVERDASGHVLARGHRYDVVYRHIFARRVEETSTFAALLRDPGPHVILNPVVSPLEVKGMLALLDEAARDDERAETYGLSAEERQAILRVVPWTRLLGTGEATLPDGTRVPDLAAWVAAHPEKVVLKRSWDYGGKSVVLGPEAEEASTRARFEALFGPECTSYAELVRRAAIDPHAWVVQEFVPPRAVRHLVCERDAAGAVVPRWRDLFVDISAYANLGVSPLPAGGACRASGSRIVNILGGGGLTPLLSTSVLAELFP
jgi:hypothetical protein